MCSSPWDYVITVDRIITVLEAENGSSGLKKLRDLIKKFQSPNLMCIVEENINILQTTSQCATKGRMYI